MNIRILGLPQKLRSKFDRAIQLGNGGTKSSWMLVQILRYIRQQEVKHGDLLLALNAEEHWLVEVVADGAAEPQQIAQETGFDAGTVENLLAELVERGVLEIRPQGGKTEKARGARRPLYVL